MNRSLVTLAIALALTAAAVTGISAFRGSDEDQQQKPAASPLKHRAFRSDSPATSGTDSATSNRSVVRPGAIDPQATALRSTALTAALENYPSRVELERRAALVEQEANHELRRLIPLLDLKPDQQERVFKALAQSSRHFAPGMSVGGDPLATAPADASKDPSPSLAAQEAVLAELDDAQIEAYLADADARSEWWQEYIARASSDLDTSAPVPGTATGDTTTPGDAVLPEKDSRAPSDEE